MVRWAGAMGEDERYRAELRAAIRDVADRHGGEGADEDAVSLLGNPSRITCMMRRLAAEHQPVGEVRC